MMFASTLLRRALTLLVVTGSGMSLLGASPASAAAGGAFDFEGARQGAFLSLDAHNGTDELQAYRDFEQDWGRRADMVRVFNTWTQPALFTPAQRTLAAEGRTLVVSWNSWDKGAGVRWSEVASGAHDARIDARAQEVKDLGEPILFTFQHEPENWTDTSTTQKAGTAADFCNAYRRVVDRFRAAGVTNASYGEVMMAWSAAKGRAEPYYCGDAHVEWLAADGYNWYGCVSPDGPWRMPKEIFEPWYTWANSHGRALVIAEWGTGEDVAVPDRKAAWIDALGTYVKERPAIKGVLIYNTAKNKNCPRYADTSPASQEAFVAMGADPWFGQGDVAPEPAGLPGPPTSLAVQRGAGAATLTWEAPGDTGGSPVTGYRVRRYDGAGDVPAAEAVVPGTARSFTATGLTNGAPYSFDVTAVNDAGRGTVSARSDVVVPATVPAAPRIATALAGQPGDAVTATATWAPPSSDGGTPVTAYLVRAVRFGASGNVLSRTDVRAPASARSLEMTLPAAGSYRFLVTAVNDVGAGAGSRRSNLVAGQ